MEMARIERYQPVGACFLRRLGNQAIVDGPAGDPEVGESPDDRAVFRRGQRNDLSDGQDVFVEQLPGDAWRDSWLQRKPCQHGERFRQRVRRDDEPKLAALGAIEPWMSARVHRVHGDSGRDEDGAVQQDFHVRCAVFSTEIA